MQFMTDNPGAGNVLLRTLASILAQRLRQMNPGVFGLSTYAVVDAVEEKAPAPLEPVPVVEETVTVPLEPVTETVSYESPKISRKTQAVPDPDADLGPRPGM